LRTTITTASKSPAERKESVDAEEDRSIEDGDDLEDLKVRPPRDAKNKTDKELVYEETKSRDDNNKQKDDDKREEAQSAVVLFQRTLENLMKQKRSEAMESLMTSENENWDLDASRKAGRITRSGERDSLRRRLETMGAFMREHVDHNVRTPSILPVDVFFATVGMVMFCWFLIGCWGMYMYFMATTSNTPLAAAPAAQEVIVRIVREVVHVNQNGEVLETMQVDADLDMEKMAQCMEGAAQ